jgi:hypothetical protein
MHGQFLGVSEHTFSHSFASNSSTSSASRLSTGASSFTSFVAILTQGLRSQCQIGCGSSFGGIGVRVLLLADLAGCCRSLTGEGRRRATEARDAMDAAAGCDAR